MTWNRSLWALGIEGVGTPSLAGTLALGTLWILGTLWTLWKNSGTTYSAFPGPSVLLSCSTDYGNPTSVLPPGGRELDEEAPSTAAVTPPLLVTVRQSSWSKTSFHWPWAKWR